HRGGQLVDVLPARARRADEALLELAVVDADAVGDSQHAREPSADERPAKSAKRSYPPARYFFARILPSSTAGWSNGSTPIRCAAMIVSSMKCISNSPRLVSSSLSTWMVRTGQPFLASVSAVARPCAATRSPMVLPAKSGSPDSFARSASMRG